MQEKLSIKKVYRNAYRYVASHLFAFAFLTIFYFLGSLLPMIFGSSSFWGVSLAYNYLFFYFAAGCYYKQRILWDREVFTAAGLRFLLAIVLFVLSIFVSSLAINVGIHIIGRLFPVHGPAAVSAVLESLPWLLAKRIFIFFLFIAFFIVPSFAFVSEITGKKRSLVAAYSKTKGDLPRIAAVVAGTFLLLWLSMLALSFVNVFLASLVRAAILVFISILYFKMYDFFYFFPQTRRDSRTAKDETEKALPRRDASGRFAAADTNGMKEKKADTTDDKAETDNLSEGEDNAG